jgi:hypothetical protein
MEDTNPQGSAKTVSDAAASFLEMMEPREPEGQPEELEVEAQDYEQDEQGEEYEQEVQETPKYRVKAGDEEIEVDLDELIKGYSRTSDYTKKTQTLAEQRKAVEAERARIDEAARLRDQYAQRLQVIEQMLTQPQEDLSALKETDPIGYAVKMAEQVERERQLNAVRVEREQIQTRQQMEHQQKLQHYLAQEAERLSAAIPEYSDPAKGEVLRKDLKDFARSVGFSEQDLANVYDHRQVVTLYKAMQYDKLMKSKPGIAKKVNEAPRTLKPGVGRITTPDQDAMKKMRSQLKKTGSKADAARIFEKFL